MTKHSQEPDVGGTGQRIQARLAGGVRTLLLRVRVGAAVAWPVVRRWALLRPVQLAGMLLIGLLVGGGVVAAVSDSDSKPSTTQPTPTATKQESVSASEDAHKPTKPADPHARAESGKPKPPAPTDHPKPPNPHNPPGGR